MNIEIRLFLFSGSPHPAGKRFESVYDLVADGLITMYVEANARDYIEHMSIQVPQPDESTSNGIMPFQSLQISADSSDQVSENYACGIYVLFLEIYVLLPWLKKRKHSFSLPKHLFLPTLFSWLLLAIVWLLSDVSYSVCQNFVSTIRILSLSLFWFS